MRPPIIIWTSRFKFIYTQKANLWRDYHPQPMYLILSARFFCSVKSNQTELTLRYVSFIVQCFGIWECSCCLITKKNWKPSNKNVCVPCAEHFCRRWIWLAADDNATTTSQQNPRAEITFFLHINRLYFLGLLVFCVVFA